MVQNIPPLFLLFQLLLSTAMAAPKAYMRGLGSEEESVTLNSGGLCYAIQDNHKTNECARLGDTCRFWGKCNLENTGYECCCDMNCSRKQRSKSAVFCGDDGVTYTSMCEWRRQQCIQNTPIEILYKGQCSDTCLERRASMELDQISGVQPVGDLPDCDEENSNLYKITQCSMSDGMKCWCVRPESNQNITQPVSVRNQRELNCEQELKIASLGCDPCLLLEQIFKALPGANNYEMYYARQISESRRIARTHEPRDDLTMVRKLFGQFDRSRDDSLSPGELDIIARWLHISRACLLNTMVGICDEDANGEINRREWCSCLMNREAAGCLVRPKLSGYQARLLIFRNPWD